MSQVLTLKLSDEVYAALQQQAKILGIDLSELAAMSLERQYRLTKDKDQRTEAEKEAARKRFRAKDILAAQLDPTLANNPMVASGRAGITL